LSLDEFQMSYPDINQSMAQAYLSGAYAMVEVGGYFGVHYMTVSHVVRKFEENKKDDI
jgi:hypothetical protein